jgi:hypothetical protein
MGEGRGVYRALMGESEGNKPRGRPRRRWENNIRMDLQEVRCEIMDWIYVLRIGTGSGHL